MKLLLAFSLLFSILSTRAQDTTRKEDNDKIFVKVEIEAVYPGGNQAWLRFLSKNQRYPDDAVNNNIQGDVVVQFLIDTAGNTSDFQVISGPVKGGLREEALRVIKLSGTWIPAIQNGQKVKSFKRQPIKFRIING